MAKLHTETVAVYTISNKRYGIDLCWQGDSPDLDKDRFYDIYDERGHCLNLGNPWHDDGNGIPSKLEVKEILGLNNG
jgi:hypothetical protein